MKAIIITTYGNPEVLKLAERPVPLFRDDEVLIEVKAAGVNRPDVFQRKGSYPAPEGAPQDIPGLEIAGVVKDIGKSVKQWKKGDRVCALIAGGGYAEYVSIGAAQCLPIPTSLSFVEVASLPETVLTVWHNVFQRGELKKDEHFLVHGGSSGIGITAIQLAKAFGARVYATAGSEEKCQACIDLGADMAINYKEQNFEEILRDEGVDVLLDMIGAAYFEKNLTILRPEGRLIYINAMQGNTVNLPIRMLMQKRITITGSTLRNRDVAFKIALGQDVLTHVWPLLEAGTFKPVIYQVFPLRDAAAAHQLMESSRHIGKIVLTLE